MNRASEVSFKQLSRQHSDDWIADIDLDSGSGAVESTPLVIERSSNAYHDRDARLTEGLGLAASLGRTRDRQASENYLDGGVHRRAMRIYRIIDGYREVNPIIEPAQPGEASIDVDTINSGIAYGREHRLSDPHLLYSESYYPYQPDPTESIGISEVTDLSAVRQRRLRELEAYVRAPLDDMSFDQNRTVDQLSWVD